MSLTMMNVTGGRPAPSWLRELADARSVYEETLGWPVSLQVGRRSLVVAAGEVLDAVAMPASLGARVRRELEMMMLDGPIIANPDGTRWTFLMQPVGGIRGDVATELLDLGVHLAPDNAYVVIPTNSVAAGNTWRWVAKPDAARALPSAYAVVGVVRRLTGEAFARGA
ncbi:hypothetical protein EV193_101738 [Herbihabitans rhizosphaerae]|uniref:DNA primase/polymerase bifunctional N-terminal domain-containing protein n=1 Tax=Herbihabitans rhizosphaerae TaxID=1872711 RepID=A0A4Q7L5E1_9PSEU|nr:hypothetical protein [Herbihabitans rhizosphaerae]RZS44858.1 hypothetical protein EV193_101738 [Herbihabitans rhizosphaerae]